MRFLESMKGIPLSYVLAGMHTLKLHSPNKGKNAGHLQSSHYPINAPHFWVYLQWCAFPPEFTSLSDSFPHSHSPHCVLVLNFYLRQSNADYHNGFQLTLSDGSDRECELRCRARWRSARLFDCGCFQQIKNKWDRAKEQRKPQSNTKKQLLNAI